MKRILALLCLGSVLGALAAFADPAAAQGFTGKFYGFANGAEHLWDFMAGGNFVHRVFAAGAGTRVGKTERGTFRISADGGSITLRTSKVSVAVGTPAVGGRGTALAGGTDDSSQVRVLSFSLDGPRNTHGAGIVIDGVGYLVRPW